MNAPTRPAKTPRRSKRLALLIRVHVFGQDTFLETFNEFTHMLTVTAHGGALALAHRVDEGKRILIVNKFTGKEQECRVVDVGSMQNGKWTVGIEFVGAVADFWKVHFPTCAPGELSAPSPLRRGNLPRVRFYH